MHICAHVCVGVDLSQRLTLGTLLHHYLIFVTMSITEPGAYCFGCQEAPRSLWSLPSPGLWLQRHAEAPDTCMHGGDLNAGPCACATSTVAMEPSTRRLRYPNPTQRIV